jgi:thymidylate synthase (FAD)
MRVVSAKTEIKTKVDGIEILRQIEDAARTCYLSHDVVTEDDTSARKIVTTLRNLGHEAMLEFSDVVVLFTVDRGVTHEIVRHRIASFAQESTRYCNYSREDKDYGGDITVINPFFWDIREENDIESIRFPTEDEKKQGITINDLNTVARLNYHRFNVWYDAMVYSETAYMRLMELGAQPQESRSVLPNSTKADICVKMNLREWRHFFKVRTSKAAHPQMREVTRPLLLEFKQLIPIVFDDLEFDS